MRAEGCQAYGLVLRGVGFMYGLGFRVWGSRMRAQGSLHT